MSIAFSLTTTHQCCWQTEQGLTSSSSSSLVVKKHKGSGKAAIPGSLTQVPQNGPSQDREKKMVERGWLKFVEDPSMWWDNRKTKKNLKDPDFVHATTGEALWINSCFCPKWVQSGLNFLQDASPDSGRGVKAHYRKIARPSFDGAHEARKSLPQLNEFSWTKLISEHTKCGQGRESLRIYKEMREEGVRQKTYTFVAALKACSSIGDLEAGKEIHAHVIESGNQSDIFVATTLVDMYVKCGSMEDARRVFERMPHRDVVSWNAMIMGYTQKEAGELALQLYARMQHEGFTPDARTFVGALKACGSLATQAEDKQVDSELMKTGCLQTGRMIHSQVAKNGFESHLFVASTLVDMYAKCGSMVDARQVFEKMPHRNVVSWNAIIIGYAQKETGELALQLYARMQHEGFTPDARTFVAALKACSSLAVQEEGKQVDGELVKIGSLEKGKAIHSQVTKSGLESDIFVANTLVDLYAKCGSMVDARQVFEKMLYRNVVSWNAMIMAYAQREDGELALQLYLRMQHEGFAPDTHTFVAVLKACGSLASLETGKEIHTEICRLGLEGDSFVATCLVDMYGKCGSMVDAQRLFDASPLRDVVRWNALIAGYSHQGDSERVFDLFVKMQQEGIQPVGSTFVSVLTVCSHAGLVDKGQKYFQAMPDYGITPAHEHYSCMVDLLGRAGQLDDAVSMVKKMPFKPDMVMWMTILGACQKWHNVEVGRLAFESAVKLDEKQAAAYVSMTNICVSARL